MNDARISILEASSKLKHPLSMKVIEGKYRDPDYIVRVNAINLLRASGEKIPADLQAGRLKQDMILMEATLSLDS